MQSSVSRQFPAGPCYDGKDDILTEQCRAEFSMETVLGRELRVARWRWNMASEHLPILFFNGIGTNIETVSALAEALVDRPFMVFDMPGTGHSPDPVVPYNPALIGWTARELLRRFDCEQVDVMGVSWGGAIAQQFALQHGDCVRRLVLCATSPGMVMHPGNIMAALQLGKPGKLANTGSIPDHFSRLFSKAAGRREDLTKRLIAPTAQGFAYQLLAMWGWSSLPALPFLRHETLIMMGGEDDIVPLANGRILQSFIPRSRLEVIDDAGHLFILTHPEQTLAAVRDFLDPGAPDSAQCSKDRKAA